MDAQFWLITIPTLLIFFSLAAALLVPIWRFLDREQEVSEHWTPEAVAERIKDYDEQSDEQSYEVQTYDAEEPATEHHSEEHRKSATDAAQRGRSDPSDASEPAE